MQRVFTGRAAATAVVVVAALSAAGAARGDVALLSAAADNTMYEDAAGALSNGAGGGMFVGRNGQGAGLIRRALVRFDIAAAIPAGATITSASLTLNVSQTGSGPQTISLHPALASWGEGTSVAGGNGGSGAPSTAGDATWIHRSFNSTFWTNPGGDFAAAPSASLPVDGLGSYTWTSALLGADVQSWLDAPGSNFGWTIVGGEASGPGTAKRFDTRQSTVESARPVLRVEYTPVPAPGVAVVMGLAGVMGARRRRRGK